MRSSTLLNVVLVAGLITVLAGTTRTARAECVDDLIKNSSAITIQGDAFTSLDVAAKFQNTNPRGCIDELTEDDRKFMGTLTLKMIGACPPSSKQDCSKQANDVVNKEYEAYGKLKGLDGLRRINAAFQAQQHQNEVQQSLELMKNPQIAPAFVKFAQTMKARTGSDRDS